MCLGSVGARRPHLRPAVRDACCAASLHGTGGRPLLEHTTLQRPWHGGGHGARWGDLSFVMQEPSYTGVPLRVSNTKTSGSLVPDSRQCAFGPH